MAGQQLVGLADALLTIQAENDDCVPPHSGIEDTLLGNSQKLRCARPNAAYLVSTKRDRLQCHDYISGGCFDKSTPRLSSTFSARPPRFSRRREWLIPIDRSLPDPCKPFHGPESATPPCVVTFPWGLLYTQHIKENILKYYPLEGLIKSTRAICKRFSAATRRNFAGIIVFISRNRNEVVAENI